MKQLRPAVQPLEDYENVLEKLDYWNSKMNFQQIRAYQEDGESSWIPGQVANLLDELSEGTYVAHLLSHGFNGYYKTLELLVKDEDIEPDEFRQEIHNFYSAFGIPSESRPVNKRLVRFYGKGIKLGELALLKPGNYYANVYSEPLFTNLGNLH